MLNTAGGLQLTLGDNTIEKSSIRSFEMLEAVNMPFPYVVTKFRGGNNFNKDLGVYISTPVSVAIQTGDIVEGSVIEQDFFVLDVREVASNDDGVDIALVAISAPLSVFNKVRRAFADMTSAEVLETLYEEIQTDDYINEIEEDGTNDKMTWFQMGSWLEMWSDVLMNSYVTEDDLVLAFKDIDGNAVVTTIKKIFSEGSPVRITQNPQMAQGGEYPDFVVPVSGFTSSLSGLSMMGAVGVDVISSVDNMNEIKYKSINGAFQPDGGDEGKILPIADYLAKGVFNSEFSFVNSNVHDNWDVGYASNRKMWELLYGMQLRVVGFGHKNLRLGVVVNFDAEKVKDDAPVRDKYAGKWLVMSNYYYLTKPTQPLHVISYLGSTGISKSEEDKDKLDE